MHWRRIWNRVWPFQKKGRCFRLKPIKLPESITKAGKILLQYRYALLILALGLVFVTIPEQKPQAEQQTVTAAEPAEPGLEAKLETILSQVEGAGTVQVILTIRESAESVYQTDTSVKGTGDSSMETVLTDQGTTEAPIAVKTISPVYQGALVVAAGGDRPSVRLDLIQAVASLTGLGTDKITVIKMKTD